jgi:hypothetical protein
VGFGPPSRCCPTIPASHLSIRGTSPGVSFPFSASGGESSRPLRLPGPAPRFPGFHQRVPPRRLRCRSQVFSTSQRLLPLSAVPPFSGGWRSWGSPFRGLILTRSPGDSSPPMYPHDVAPAGLEPPILGRGIHGRDGRRLGRSGRLLRRLQGLPPRVESVCVAATFS